MEQKTLSIIKKVFIHIPKAGGSSTIDYLTNCFGPEKTLNVLPANVRNCDSILRESNAELFTGHFFLRDISNETMFEKHFFTILRNPFESVLSNYYFKRQVSQSSFPTDSDPAVGHAFANSLLDTLKIYQDEGISDFSNPAVGQLSSLPLIAPIDEHYKSASKNLSSFIAFGIFEDLHSSLLHIMKVLGHMPFGTVPHLNQTGRRRKIEEVGSETLRLIKKMNTYDIELYNKAKDLYSKNVKLHIISLPKPEKKLREKNQYEIGTKDFVIDELTFGTREPGFHSWVEVSTGEMLSIRIKIKINRWNRDVTVGLSIKDIDGITAFATNSFILNHKLDLKEQKGFAYVHISMVQSFLPGDYIVQAALHKGAAHTGGCYHWKDVAGKFRVVQNDKNLLNSLLAAALRLGCIDLDKILKIAPESVARIKIEVINGPFLGQTPHPWILLINESDSWLSSDGPNPVHISYRVIDKNGLVIVNDGLRTRIDPPLQPRAKGIYPLRVQSIDKSSMYMISLVQETQFWFMDLDPNHGIKWL